MTCSTAVLVVLGVLTCGAAAAAEEVVGWRGDGSGVFAGTGPVTWDLASGAGVCWKTELPPSSSSPVVVGDGVLTLAEPDEVVCLAAADGVVRWRQRLVQPPDPKAKKPAKPGDYGFTLPTPASDGVSVWVAMLPGMLACFDLAGTQRWTVALPPGFRGASPVVCDGVVLVAYATAVHAFAADSGRPLWTQEGLTAVDHGGTGAVAIWRSGATAVAITPGGAALRVADGTVLASDLGRSDCGTSPLVVGDLAWFSFGDPYCRTPQGVAAVGLALAGGRLTGTPMWRQERAKGTTIVPPVVADGVVHAVARGSPALLAFDAATGEPRPAAAVAYQSPGHVWRPAPAVCGGHLYLVMPDEAGTCVVERLGANPGVVATNRLGRSSGSPVFAADRMYVRSFAGVLCLGTARKGAR